MTDNQRTIAGRYQVKDLIGRGGMADVYEGVDTRLGRVVAIKILRADLAADSSFEARFRQEAQASARMAHPTIVRIYDAGEEHLIDANGNAMRRPYIVMEYVHGVLLRDLIHQRQLEVREAISIAEGVLTALEVSHRSGVIHRDIKSANIMITETGLVKVMDFGIARAITDSSATQAHTSGIVGTAQYFSPEQAKGETVDSRTDLYSTGVLLYEMLTGRAPFRGETAVSVAYQHVSEAVVPPSKINPNLSPEIDALVLRALAKDRNERFQSAEQFREHLLAAFSVSRNFVAPTLAAPAAEPQAPALTQVLPFAEPAATEVLLTAPATTGIEIFDQLIEQSDAPDSAAESGATNDLPPVEHGLDTAAATQASTSTSTSTQAFGFDDLLNAAVAEAAGGTSSAAGAQAASAGAQAPSAGAQAAAETPRQAPAAREARPAEHAQADSSPYFYETRETPRVVSTPFGGEHTNPFEAIGVQFEADLESESRRERKVQKAANSAAGFKPLGGGLLSGPKTKTKSILWGVISGLVVVLLGLGVWSISAIGSIHVNVPTSAAVTVPDVSGQTYDDALATITHAKLLVTRTFETSDTVALNSVIRIDPVAGTSVSPNTTITVYVSGGKSQVKVPYLANTLETEANAALTAVGLTRGKISQQNSVDVPKGTIISTSPVEYTQLPKGSPVDLVVSTGKVTVPSVIQQSVTSAKAILTGSDIGFSVKIEASTGTCTGTLGQIVTGQSIAAGDADQHQSIVLYVDCVGGTNPTPSASPSPTL